MTPTAPHDPEFATSVLGPVGLAPPEDDPELYLRVVANPFLAVTGLAVWLMLLRGVAAMLWHRPELIGPLTPLLAVLFLAGLLLLPQLIHYHCLDCGATGRLSRWRRHICAASSLRRLSERPRRFRGPRPLLQLILWLWGLLFLAVLCYALGLRWLPS